MTALLSLIAAGIGIGLGIGVAFALFILFAALIGIAIVKRHVEKILLKSAEEAKAEVEKEADRKACKLMGYGRAKVGGDFTSEVTFNGVKLEGVKEVSVYLKATDEDRERFRSIVKSVEWPRGRTAATESLKPEPLTLKLDVPTPGRIVMTTSVSGKLWPAMVAYVHRPGHPESEVDLFVFSTDNGGYISKDVPQGNGPTEWRWPTYAKPVRVLV